MLIFIAWFVLAIVVGFGAEARRRSGPGWFILAVAISPLLAAIALLLVGPGTPRAGSSAEQMAGLKTCPKCAEQVKAAALVCRFCQYEFPAQPPSAAASNPWSAEVVPD